MIDNISCDVVKKEFQKKIINYLYLNNYITISEYEILVSKCDEKLLKFKDGFDKYYPINVDIKI